MNRAQLIQALAKDTRIGTEDRAEDALGAVEDAIKTALGLGRVVGINRFGTFWVVDRPARTEVHDGKVRRLPARKGIAFRPDKPLREVVSTRAANEQKSAS